MSFSSSITTYNADSDDLTTILFSHDLENEAESEEKTEQSEKEERKVQPYDSLNIDVFTLQESLFSRTNQIYNSPHLSIFLTPPEFRS
ncbi:MAG: hypothetical protein DCO95_03665 [Roseivirga sp. XM-24bin3]|nr:MAG: hypothetical protein DCO95_03665 [Roseivirga sp. XM-24bin3]